MPAPEPELDAFAVLVNPIYKFVTLLATGSDKNKTNASSRLTKPTV